MSTQRFNLSNFGEVEVRNAMFDIDGTNIEEGIEIKSLDGDFDIIEIYGYIDVSEITSEDLTELINNSLK